MRRTPQDRPYQWSDFDAGSPDFQPKEMTMEYDATAQAQVIDPRAYAGSRSQLGEHPARPADLNALCQQLERHIERAREASLRIRDHADRMFGSRPETANTKGAEIAPTLANLIDLLGDQIASIENGLSRL